MYPCLLLKVLAEYDLQLCACSKRNSCVPVFLYALRGDTRPGYISPLPRPFPPPSCPSTFSSPALLSPPPFLPLPTCNRPALPCRCCLSFLFFCLRACFVFSCSLCAARLGSCSFFLLLCPPTFSVHPLGFSYLFGVFWASCPLHPSPCPCPCPSPGPPPSALPLFPFPSAPLLSLSLPCSLPCSFFLLVCPPTFPVPAPKLSSQKQFLALRPAPARLLPPPLPCSSLFPCQPAIEPPCLAVAASLPCFSVCMFCF